MSLNNSNTGQAFWLVLGSLSTMAISIVSAMVLSRYFEKAEYGTYRQILFVYNAYHLCIIHVCYVCYGCYVCYVCYVW